MQLTTVHPDETSLQPASEVRLCLLGAEPDTTNLGVSALCYSTLSGIARRLPDANITVFDNGWGARGASLYVSGKSFNYTRCGGRMSWRLYRPESYRNMRLNWNLGRLRSPALQALSRAHAALDVSGGDSFCDLYGPRVFHANTAVKHMLLEHGVPLILLPQTYGPFHSPPHRDIARTIVRQASLAWARDNRSFQILKDLLGEHFDPQRHLSGVDLAFGLEPIEPWSIPPTLADWLTHRTRPLIGFNISGLIYNDPHGMIHRYGFKADYRQAVIQLLRLFLTQTDCNILLIPHVLTADHCIESDKDANLAVLTALGRDASWRILPLHGGYGPAEAKWIISHTDWFCGTRMHSTIAALSSAVPTAAISYSIKTAGVFESCNLGHAVANPCILQTPDVVEHLWNSWLHRTTDAQTLADALPSVFRQADQQMNQLAAALTDLTSRSETPRLH